MVNKSIFIIEKYGMIAMSLMIYKTQTIGKIEDIITKYAHGDY